MKIKRLYLLVVDRQDEYIITFPLCVCVLSVGRAFVGRRRLGPEGHRQMDILCCCRSEESYGRYICFLRKSKGPSSSEKGNRTTPFDVHPYIHNKICNILYPIPLVIIIVYMLYVFRNSRPSRGRRRSLCLKPILPYYYCVYVFG